MKTAIIYGPKKIKVENVGDPKLEPDGAIIRVRACGICGSDVHIYNQGWSSSALGHEFSGDVVEVGRNVKDIKTGMRVVVSGAGAYAEYVGLPRALLNGNVFPMPDDMSYEIGATTEPVSIGVNAAKRAEPKPDDVVVVLGAGMIGQGTWQAFKVAGVSRVVVVEIGRKRLEVTRSLGADIVIDAAEQDPVKKVLEMTSGEGADIVADCGGYATALQQATDMVRGGGYWYMTRIANTNQARPGRPTIDTLSDGGKIMVMAMYESKIEWQPTNIMIKQVRMIGCLGGSLRQALDLMIKGKIHTETLITHELPLDRITEAFEMQAKPDQAIKVMIKP